MIEDWIALTTTAGIGRATAIKLAQRFGGAREVRETDRKTLIQAGLSESIIAALRTDSDLCAETLDWLSHDGHAALSIDDPDYPPLLARIPDPPALLYVIGDPLALWTPQIAVVGSRKPTQAGLATTELFVRGFATSGLTVTSGLALGVDACAHRGAISEQIPTVAVMGTGLDQVYPARNRDLAHAIATGGALVSEFPLGTGVRASHFPSRNRIISGLSLGTVVIEAALRSGSLITARLAAEQGREVFAVPGSIHSPLARGCHRLIRDGARLVERPQEVVEAVTPLARDLGEAIRGRLSQPETEPSAGNMPISARSHASDPDYQALLGALGFDPVSADQLVSATTLTPDAVSSMLLLLELEGVVESCPGGRFCLSVAPR